MSAPNEQTSVGSIQNGLQAAVAELDELEKLYALISEHLEAAYQLAAKEIEGSSQDAATSVIQGITQMIEEVEGFNNQIQQIKESANDFVGQVA